MANKTAMKKAVGVRTGPKGMTKSDLSLLFPPLGCTVRPFLRWAGGKQKVVKYLLPCVPPCTSYKKYFEPFLGGGSLFFALGPEEAILSDVNTDLINCYQQVARFPKAVNTLLRRYALKDSRAFYEKIRTDYRNNLTAKQRAALFIYLNKAAFNGIYRVNKIGQFNVPYGPSASGISLPSEDQLIAASRSLRRAKLATGDFEKILKTAVAGDFIYLDPPYPPRNSTSFFTHYSADRFEWEQQIRVARIFQELADRGCFVMLTNSDQKKIIELYRLFNITRLNVRRWIGSNGDRSHVGEIVVTNYELMACPT